MTTFSRGIFSHLPACKQRREAGNRSWLSSSRGLWRCCRNRLLAVIARFVDVYHVRRILWTKAGFQLRRASDEWRVWSLASLDFLG